MASLFSYTEVIEIAKQYDCHNFIKRNRIHVRPERDPIKQEKRETGRNLEIIGIPTIKPKKLTSNN
jgi:hypothetical protein